MVTFKFIPLLVLALLWHPPEIKLVDLKKAITWNRIFLDDYADPRQAPITGRNRPFLRN